MNECRKEASVLSHKSQIPEIILKVYDSARCHLNPEEWLDWCIIDGTQIDDISQTPWGKYLIDDLKQFLCGYIDAFRRCVSAASFVDAMEKPIALFSETLLNCIVMAKQTIKTTVPNIICALKSLFI